MSGNDSFSFIVYFVFVLFRFFHYHIFSVRKISYPLIRTSTCPYQGVRKDSFSQNFAYVLDG